MNKILANLSFYDYLISLETKELRLTALMAISGYTQSEIADFTRVSQKTVSKRLKHIRLGYDNNL